jgi:hypothetical protein
LSDHHRAAAAIIRRCDLIGGVGLERFPAKWAPVRVKKTRQNKKLEPRSDSIGTEKALDVAASRRVASRQTFVGAFPDSGNLHDPPTDLTRKSFPLPSDGIHLRPIVADRQPDLFPSKRREAPIRTASKSLNVKLLQLLVRSEAGLPTGQRGCQPGKE